MNHALESITETADPPAFQAAEIIGNVVGHGCGYWFLRNDPAEPFVRGSVSALRHGGKGEPRSYINNFFPYGRGRHRGMVPRSHGTSS